jgi:nascent polypeptide-associated complex subunit beta
MSLKKLAVNNIQGIDEINMFKDNGEVIHFVNPRVQASLASNVFVIQGQSETKRKSKIYSLLEWKKKKQSLIRSEILELADMLPSMMQSLGGDSLFNLKNLTKTLANTNLADELKSNLAAAAAAAGDEDIPELVENFDEVSKNEK